MAAISLASLSFTIDMTDKCKATVAALLPTLGGVDMSFLLGVAINVPALSSDLFNSCSSADDTSTDLSKAIKVEDVACSVHLQEETKVIGGEEEVHAVWVSFIKEQADESDNANNIDDEGTKKLASPSSNKKEESGDDDDSYYGDLRNFVLPLTVNDFLKLKWSDVLSKNNNEAAAGSSEHNKE